MDDQNPPSSYALFILVAELHFLFLFLLLLHFIEVEHGKGDIFIVRIRYIRALPEYKQARAVTHMLLRLSA
jgi:hypothetical protein